MANSVLVITDSRGRDLDFEFRKACNITFTLVIYPGAGLVKLLNKALANVPKAYDLIFISGGICDITEKCKQPKKISLRGNATTTLVDDLEAMVRENLAVLRCHNPNVIMTTTYEVSLSDYILNYNGPVPHPQQKDLNDCVRRLNVMLAVLNKECSLPTPWICRPVHHYHGKRRPQHRYHSL